MQKIYELKKGENQYMIDALHCINEVFYHYSEN